MKRSALATVSLALVVSACATVNIFGDRAEERLALGLSALERSDFETASREIGWVASNYSGDEIGRRALLAAAALEIDPRNPRRRLSYGADLTAAFLGQPERTPDWLEPVARSLYLSALELGAAEERVAQAEAQKNEAEQRAEEVERKLPQLPSASVASRLREASAERDRLARRLEQLEKDLAERTRKLSDTEKELERIRKTLKS